MKSLIIYDSKKGTTEDCAKRVQSLLECDIVSLKSKTNINLDNYDLVIIGTPIYMGQLMKSVLQFCKKNIDLLKSKHLAFFTCGLTTVDEALASFKMGMSKELAEKAIIISHFGGEFRTDKANFLERFIIKAISKSKKPVFDINDDLIEDFILKVKGIK